VIVLFLEKRPGADSFCGFPAVQLKVRQAPTTLAASTLSAKQVMTATSLTTTTDMTRDEKGPRASTSLRTAICSHHHTHTGESSTAWHRRPSAPAMLASHGTDYSYKYLPQMQVSVSSSGWLQEMPWLPA
jgi:hypothetical protein